MKESKIKDLFENSKTIYVFDVDGVLARLELGEYTHYFYNDEMWEKALQTHDFYDEIRPIISMQDFIQKRNKEHIYVATRVYNEVEHKQKISFLEKHYGILKDHVYLVYNNDEKLDVMNKIKELNPNLEDKYFVMIDDTVDVLNHIMDNSNFSTVHISSFLQ